MPRARRRAWTKQWKIPFLRPQPDRQDAASGFETDFPEIAGTCAVLPSLLAMAMTWDPTVVRGIGEALGQEFEEKRSN